MVTDPALSLASQLPQSSVTDSKSVQKRPPSVLKALQRNDIATPFASDRCARLWSASAFSPAPSC